MEQYTIQQNDKTRNSDEYDTCDSYNLSNLKLSKTLQKQLSENYPDVLEFITTLRKLIEKQKKRIRKLKAKLKKKTELKEVGVQTDVEACETNDSASKTLCEDITKAAEMAVQKTGFVYEETSGLYYDYNSGYYYNAELGLYYEGNSGTYLTYNTDTQTYDFHSQVEVVSNSHSSTQSSHTENPLHKRKKQNQAQSKVIISSDMENLMQSFNQMNVTPLRKLTLEISKAWPPCMRIIVKTTKVPKLKEGSLFIITYSGGTLGREGNHSIIIPDINISKHHLKFEFDKPNDKYMVTDLGSRNGTLLNGKRISASKQESSAVEVAHGSEIQIGSTILLCHIHNGNETCGHCEPGLLQTSTDEKDNSVKLSKNEQHKKELRKLRKKFGIEHSDTSNTKLATGYTDRAEVRRQTVGSHNEHEKTEVANLDESIKANNKGFKLLSKMGWSEGQSLGKEGTGILKPVELQSASGTAGIGYAGNFIQKKDSFTNSQNIWEKTQKRYNQLVIPLESDESD